MLQKYFILKIISTKDKGLRIGVRYAKAVISDTSCVRKYILLFFMLFVFPKDFH